MRRLRSFARPAKEAQAIALRRQERRVLRCGVWATSAGTGGGDGRKRLRRVRPPPPGRGARAAYCALADAVVAEERDGADALFEADEARTLPSSVTVGSAECAELCWMVVDGMEDVFSILCEKPILLQAHVA